MLLYWSLPERCFYIGHSPRDNYTKFLFFLRHSPTILSSLGLFSNYMCSVKRTFLLHKNCLKKIRLVKLGMVPLRCHLPILGELATSAREAAVPLFSHLPLCPATLQISYPILGPALSYLDQPLKVLQDSGRVDIDLWSEISFWTWSDISPDREETKTKDVWESGTLLVGTRVARPTPPVYAKKQESTTSTQFANFWNE